MALPLDGLLTGVIFAAIAAFAYGASNFLQKVYVEHISPARLNAYRNFFMTIILGLLLLLIRPAIDWDLGAFLLGMGAAAVSYFGLYFLNVGFQKGDAGVIAPLSSTRVIFSTIIGILFLSDPVTITQLGFIAIIFLGIVLISINFKALRNSDLFNPQTGLIFALLTAVIWGITFPFFGVFSAALGVMFFTWLVETTVFVMAALQVKAQGDRLLPAKVEVSKYGLGVFAVAALGTIASATQNAAYLTGYISVVTAIVAASPLITTLLAAIFLKERLTLQQYLGIALIISGVVAVSIL